MVNWAIPDTVTPIPNSFFSRHTYQHLFYFTHDHIWPSDSAMSYAVFIMLHHTPAFSETFLVCHALI